MKAGRRYRAASRPATVLTVAAGLVAVVVVAVVALSATGSTGSTQSADAPPGSRERVPGAAALTPITVSGEEIRRDGQRWWFAGYNSFVWSGNCGTDQEKMSAADVDAWFASMRHDGHGAVRLFFFDGWNLSRLDAAVAAAHRYGLYLTITLDDARGDCGTSVKNPDWFADPSSTQAYEDHLREVVTRYRGDPAIAWFEYFNEPTDAADLRPFYDRMGAVAKGIDPDRLFSSGVVAPYAVGGDGAYRAIHESPGVDIASLHEYDENEVESHHGPAARAAAAGKPVVVGEFGIKSGPGCGEDDATRAQRFAAKVRAYVVEGYAGALAWAWQPGGQDACAYGNLDHDAAAQDVLRTVGP